jgi:hypothetical protein
VVIFGPAVKNPGRVVVHDTAPASAGKTLTTHGSAGAVAANNIDPLPAVAVAVARVIVNVLESLLSRWLPPSGKSYIAVAVPALRFAV